MNAGNASRFPNMLAFWEHLPQDQGVITGVLRQIVLDHLPIGSRERLSYNVPTYYGKKRICLIWPASVPRGGVTSGVLLGFSRGYQLKDIDNYLDHGTNKRIFYKIYQTPEAIDEKAIVRLLKEAMRLDAKL